MQQNSWVMVTILTTLLRAASPLDVEAMNTVLTYRKVEGDFIYIHRALTTSQRSLSFAVVFNRSLERMA